MGIGQTAIKVYEHPVELFPGNLERAHGRQIAVRAFIRGARRAADASTSSG